VLLDLDDTLYPERDYVVSGLRAVSEFLASRTGLGMERDQVALRLQALLDEGRERLFDRMLGQLGIDDPSLLSTLVHVYRSHRPAISLCSDVLPFLGRLREAGVRLGIVTDGKGLVQRNKIETLALAQQVDAIICTDDLLAGCSKPSTVPFEIALRYLQVSPEEAVYVGDDLSKDFIGPRRLGMRTIRIDRGFPHPLQPRTDFPDNHQADAVCRNMLEVEQRLGNQVAAH